MFKVNKIAYWTTYWSSTTTEVTISTGLVCRWGKGGNGPKLCEAREGDSKCFYT